MPVLTKDEYMKLKEQGTAQAVPDSGSIEKKEVKTVKYLWYLMHPEMGYDEKPTFQDVLNIDGNEYERICVNGTVKTDQKVLRDFLVKKGYFEMHKEVI